MKRRSVGAEIFLTCRKNISPNQPALRLVRFVQYIMEDSKMKKSHIAVIALSVSIAFLALFVGGSDTGTAVDGYDVVTVEAE